MCRDDDVVAVDGSQESKGLLPLFGHLQILAYPLWFVRAVLHVLAGQERITIELTEEKRAIVASFQAGERTQTGIFKLCISFYWVFKTTGKDRPYHVRDRLVSCYLLPSYDILPKVLEVVQFISSVYRDQRGQLLFHWHSAWRLCFFLHWGAVCWNCRVSPNIGWRGMIEGSPLLQCASVSLAIFSKGRLPCLLAYILHHSMNSVFALRTDQLPFPVIVSIGFLLWL